MIGRIKDLYEDLHYLINYECNFKDLEDSWEHLIKLDMALGKDRREEDINSIGKILKEKKIEKYNEFKGKFNGLLCKYAISYQFKV